MLSQTGRGHRLDMVTDLTLIFKILNKKNLDPKKIRTQKKESKNFVGPKKNSDFVFVPPPKKCLDPKFFGPPKKLDPKKFSTASLK